MTKSKKSGQVKNVPFQLLIGNFRRKKIIDTLKKSVRGKISQDEAKEMLKPYEKYIQRVLDGAKELHENGSEIYSAGESQYVHTIPEEPKLEKNELMVDDSEGEDGELGERSSMSPTVVQSVHNYKNRQVHKLRA